MARSVAQALLLVAMLIMNSCAQDTDAAEYLLNLEKELGEVVASLNQTHEGHANSKRHEGLPKTCERGMGDDVRKTYPPYVIMSHAGPKRQILCDTHTDGGGWIIFQRRVKGDVDFYRDWTSYREGFGSLTGDFWMGNEALFNITDKDPYELRIDVRINNGQEVFARYSNFRIENESNRYRLQVGSYSGTGGDGMTYHGGAFFSTFDRDNDQRSGSCAVSSRGAWWYKSCYRADLNREWGVTETNTHGWYDGRTHWPVSFSEMKMRRIHVI